MQRLFRQYQRLSARERATLVLNAYREGENPPDELIMFMPVAQASDFRRYLRMYLVASDLVIGARLLHASLTNVILAATLTGHWGADFDAGLLRGLYAPWSQLLAWEQLRDGLVNEFGNPVIVPALLSESLEGSRLLLNDCVEAFEATGLHVVPPERDAEMLDALREFFDRHLRRWSG